MTFALTATNGNVATVTMTHSAKLNALGADLVGELIEALKAAKSAGVRALVLRAEEGSKTWSAGHDVNELPTDGVDPLRWASPLEKLLRAVREAPFPVIAAVEGGVWGGACDLISAADIVIATTNATFAITPAKLGVPYNTVGVSHFLNTLPLHIIKEMFFTANPISAQVAHQHGLVNVLVETGAELGPAANVMAERIATMAPLVIRAIKCELAALTDARPLTPDTFEHLTARRQDAWRSKDYAEGLAAFHERRPARFTGK